MTHFAERLPELTEVLPVLAKKVYTSLRLISPQLTSASKTIAEDNEQTMKHLLKAMEPNEKKQNDLAESLAHIRLPSPTARIACPFQRLYSTPDGSMVFAVLENRVRAWRVGANDALEGIAVETDREEPISLEWSFSPDSAFLALPYATYVAVYDLRSHGRSRSRSRSPAAPLRPVRLDILTHEGNNARISIRKVLFRPDGRRLAVAFYDRDTYRYTIQVWERSAPDQTPYFTFQHRFFKQGHSINTMAYSPNGHYLAAGGDDKRISVWNGRLNQRHAAHADDEPHEPLVVLTHRFLMWIVGIRFDDATHRLIVADSTGVFHTWTLSADNDPTRVDTVATHFIQCHYPSFSPDGTLVANGAGKWAGIRSTLEARLDDPPEAVHTLPSQNDTYFTMLVFYTPHILVGQTDKNIYIFVKHPTGGRWLPKPYLCVPCIYPMTVSHATGMLYYIYAETLYSYSLAALNHYLYPGAPVPEPGAARGGSRRKQKNDLSKRRHR